VGNFGNEGLAVDHRLKLRHFTALADEGESDVKGELRSSRLLDCVARHGLVQEKEDN